MISIVANHLWQSTLFVVVMALLALVLRRNGAHLRYWLWMAASIKFILPFSLLVALGNSVGAQFELQKAVPAKSFAGMPGQWSTLATSVVQPVASYTGKPVIQTEIASFKSLVNVEFIVVGIWAIGFIAVVGFWLARWLRLRATLRLSKLLALADLGANFPIPVRCAPGQIEPGVVGIFRPVLLLPEGLCERLTGQQVQAILAHERCHLERRDNLTATVHMLVESVFWFHPLIWWIGGRLIEERERACDAAVLKAGNDPETYASGILDVCQHYVAAPLDCVAGVSGADLKKRVRSIMTFRGEARMHIMKGLLLAFVSLAVVVSPIFFGAFTASDAEAFGTPPAAADNAGQWPTIATSSIAIGEEPNNGIGKSLLTGPNGTFSTRNWSLRGVIAYAYGIQDSEIQELTASVTDIASTRYNLLAQSPDINATGLEEQKQFKLLVRRLLDEKFRLKFHWETRRTPVYVMSVSVPNLGIKVAKADDPGPSQGRGVNSVSGHSTPLILLKQFLSNQLRRPIVDQTGLTGRYNYKVKWGPEPGDPGVSDTHEAVVAINNPTSDALIEAMQSQLGITLVSQDADVQRMVIDQLEQPLDLKPKPVEVSVDPEILDRYVGYYDFPQSQTLTIIRNGDAILAQLTGQPPLPIFPTSERDFFAKAVDARATFTADERSRVTGVVLHQGGREFHGGRLAEAIGKARVESLKLRIRDKIAQPGTDISLRKHLEGMLKDQPAFEIMAKEVADAVREQRPMARTRYAQLGPLKSIAFKSVDPTGADMYLAVFENGSTEWRVGLDADGKIDRLNYRRVSP